MRLAALTLENYGPFQHQDLSLDPAPGRINLLVAPNGAGKSVLRRAFGDLLFDIPERSPMSWLSRHAEHAHFRPRCATRAGEVTLIRRKGRGNTLSDGAGAGAAGGCCGGCWAAPTGGCSRICSRWTATCCARAGRQLSRSSGRLGAMLLAGSGGLGRVQRLLDELTGARDAIGRAERRHEAQPLWKARKEAIEAGRALQQAALRPEAFLALEKRAAEAAAAHWRRCATSAMRWRRSWRG